MSDWTDYRVSDFAKNIRGDFSNIPRFGHTRNIELLVSPNKRDQQNYINGIISFVILIIMLVGFWCLALVYFRCRGTKRYGCLAGQFTYADPKGASKGLLRRVLVWILFLISGILVIVSPFVLIRSAYPKIHTAAVNTRILNQSVKGLLAEGYAATNSTISIENTLKTTNLTETDIRSYCGSSFNESAFLSSLNYNTTIIIPFLTKDQRRLDSNSTTNVIDNIIQGITSVQEYLNQSNTTQVRSLLSTGLNASKTIENILHEVIDHDWIIKMFSLFLIAIVIIMIVLGLLNVCGKNPYFFHVFLFWLIVPSFILFIIFSWALAMLVTVAAVMNSDLCFGGQNKTAVSTALAALKIKGDSNGILYNTILYYDSSCISTSPWDYLSNYTQAIDVGTNASMIILLSNITTMTNACGRDISPILANLANIEPLTSNLQRNLQSSMELASCSRVYPLFNQTFNGSLCQENIDGLDLSSVSIFCIAVFGLLVITLRSSLYGKNVLSMERDDDKPTSIVVQGNMIPDEEIPTTLEPKSPRRFFRKKDAMQPTIVQGNVRSRESPIREPGKTEAKEVETVKATEQDLPEHGTGIQAEVGESDEYEVVFEKEDEFRSDDYSELSDPSKLMKQPDPLVNGHPRSERESKLFKFFKKQSLKKL